jgi:uncharacterized protein with HEPN domain
MDDVEHEQRRRLEDVLRACHAIAGHVLHGPPEDPMADELVADAVRCRLIEIGEAVQHLDPDLLDREPDIPWSQVARMRELLARRDYDPTHAIVGDCVRHDLPDLLAAVLRLLDFP